MTQYLKLSDLAPPVPDHPREPLCWREEREPAVEAKLPEPQSPPAPKSKIL